MLPIWALIPPLRKFLSGGRGDQKVKGDLMLRAFAFSLVFHFIILLGSRLFVPPFLFEVSNGGRGLSASLVDRPSNNSASSSIFPVTADAKKKQPESLERLVTKKTPKDSLGFPQFSRSTVAGDSPTTTPSTPQVRGEQIISSSQVERKGAASAEEVGEYRLSLAREARRFKRDPMPIGEMVLVGVVVLTIRASDSSGMPSVSIEKSSGIQALDTQALEMMASAAKAVLMPETLRGKPFAISLPVHYRLGD